MEPAQTSLTPLEITTRVYLKQQTVHQNAKIMTHKLSTNSFTQLREEIKQNRRFYLQLIKINDKRQIQKERRALNSI